MRVSGLTHSSDAPATEITPCQVETRQLVFRGNQECIALTKILKLLAFAPVIFIKKLICSDIIDLEDRERMLFQNRNNFRSECPCPLLKLPGDISWMSCQDVKKTILLV